MYEKTTSKGIVLRRRAMGEDSLRVSILTEEFGFVAASARAARRSSSKLRYGLEPLTSAKFSLVRGRHEWRVAEARNIKFLGLSARSGRIVQLLLRLVHGEGKNEQLFNAVAEGLALIAKAEWECADLSRRSVAEADAIETVLVLRILAHLGYLPQTPALAPFVEEEFSVELSAKALESRSLLVRTINESLQATGL